ncbi:MAG: hypothetical protein JSW39_13405 [Desulfobacterales bacterium]|nr:MAG: hypothetical protein JSW39_13405 [Desulfobacterales bacterium]
MSANTANTTPFGNKSTLLICAALVIIGLAAFVAGLAGPHPQRAWQAYLINFLLWSAMAQGALVFSAVMQVTRARWSGPLAGLSESFAAFFPLSFGLFLLLWPGRSHIFPWLHEDLHGKEVWLNIPFLFTRDGLGLLILYGLGFAYLYHALRLKLDGSGPQKGLRKMLCDRWAQKRLDPEQLKRRIVFIGGFYILAFALVLSLIGYDLVMSMDPHWISTLFGAYNFVKAFYLGLGALIILAAIFQLRRGGASGLMPSHFHDIGKLFFAFCLLWADFFYVQLVVIWYGNIPEETHFVIKRVALLPWNHLAWTVFGVCFLLPFFILLNQKIKTKPAFMIILCTAIVVGIWLEHLLLLGPSLAPNVAALPLRLEDGLISLGFLGLMAIAVIYCLNIFPEMTLVKKDN